MVDDDQVKTCFEQQNYNYITNLESVNKKLSEENKKLKFELDELGKYKAANDADYLILSTKNGNLVEALHRVWKRNWEDLPSKFDHVSLEDYIEHQYKKLGV